jgi:hypothetical protein
VTAVKPCSLMKEEILSIPSPYLMLSSSFSVRIATSSGRPAGFICARQDFSFLAFHIDLHDGRMQSVGVDGAHFDQARIPFGAYVMRCGWAAGRYGYVVPRATDGVRLDADAIGDAIESMLARNDSMALRPLANCYPVASGSGGGRTVYRSCQAPGIPWKIRSGKLRSQRLRYESSSSLPQRTMPARGASASRG